MSTILGVHVQTRPPLGWNVSPSELQKIADVTYLQFGFTLPELRRKDNHRQFVEARRYFALQARKEGFSYPVIAAYLWRHHTTILHLVQTA